MPTLTQIAESERLRANAANEQRYQQSLATLQTARQRMTSLFASARGLLATSGRQAGMDIDVGARRLQAQTTQQLMTSGLGGTTVRGAMARGIETDRTAAQARLAEGVGAQQAGLLTQQAGAEMGGAQALTGLMGQKQDIGPDFGRYASLTQAAARAGGGGYTPADWSSLRGESGTAGLQAQREQRRTTQEQEWQRFLAQQQATRTRTAASAAAPATAPAAAAPAAGAGGGGGGSMWGTYVAPGGAEQQFGTAPEQRFSRYGSLSAAGRYRRVTGGALVRR